MTADEALNALAERFDIVASFHDLSGAERHILPDTQKALLRANGLDLSTEPLIREALAEEQARGRERRCPAEVIVASQTPCELEFGAAASWQLTAEGSDTVLAEGGAEDRIALPALRSGLYDLAVRFAGRGSTVRCGGHQVTFAPDHRQLTSAAT